MKSNVQNLFAVKLFIIMLLGSILSNAESIFKELLELSIKDVYTPWKWESYLPYNSR